MSDDNELLNPIVQRAIREAQKVLGTYEEFGVLGDENGRINSGLPKNRVYVRKLVADGQYSKAYVAIAHTHRTGAYMLYAGSPIVLGYLNSELFVVGQNHKTTESLGYNPAVLNTGDPTLQGVATTDLLPLLSHAVGTSVNPSTKIGFKSFRYYTPENEVKWFVGSVPNQVDLSSFIPSAGEHRYVCVFFNTQTANFTVRGSTAQVLAIPLSEDDKQECYDDMPPYAIPVSMWRLQDGQTAVTQVDFVEDLRPLWGQGTSRQNISATSDPTATDDSDSGYGVGSYWVNVTADRAYICVDSTVSSAVWQRIDNTAGFTSFTVAGDTGTPQTITDGDTLTFEGTNGIATVATATDTIQISGGAFVQSFDVDGDTGTPQTINNGNTITFEGTGGIATIAKATDTIEINGDAFIQSFTVVGDAGSSQFIGDGDTFQILGGGGIKTTSEATDVVRVYDSWDYTEILVGTGAFDVTLSSISTWDSSVTQIIMQLVLRSAASGTADSVYAFFNNSTTVTNYTRQAAGAQAGVAGVATANDPLINLCPANGSPANSFGLQTVNILLPNSTGNLKGFHNIGGSRLDTGTNLRVDNIFSIWNSASAVTRIQVRTDNHPTDLFATGSSFRLRFIK